MKVRVLIEMDDGASGIRAVNALDSAMREYNEKLRRAVPEAEIDFEVLGIVRDAEVRAGVVAEEPEWEYGYTSKWGTITASSQADAESRAADHARGIAQHRESGDLKYHGKVVKRIAAPKPGEWVPVKQEGADDDV